MATSWLPATVQLAAMRTMTLSREGGTSPGWCSPSGWGLASCVSLGLCFFQSFLPDPILKLKGVIGFGGHSTKWVRALMFFLELHRGCSGRSLCLPRLPMRTSKLP